MADKTKVIETDLLVHMEEIIDLNTGQITGHQGIAINIIKETAITGQDHLQETIMVPAEIMREEITTGEATATTEEMKRDMMIEEVAPELPIDIQSSCQELMLQEITNHGQTNTVRNVFREETIMNICVQPTSGSAPPSVADVAKATISQQTASQAKEPEVTPHLGHRPETR